MKQFILSSDRQTLPVDFVEQLQRLVTLDYKQYIQEGLIPDDIHGFFNAYIRGYRFPVYIKFAKVMYQGKELNVILVSAERIEKRNLVGFDLMKVYIPANKEEGNAVYCDLMQSKTERNGDLPTYRTKKL